MQGTICGSLNRVYTYTYICCYSLKIFLRFWLAKITRIIHRNQLLSIKFGAILSYWTSDVKSAAKLQTFYSFHQEGIGELLAKNIEEQQEDNSKGDIYYLEKIFVTLNNPLTPKLTD